jgi:hypothetical protein
MMMMMMMMIMVVDDGGYFRSSKYFQATGKLPDEWLIQSSDTMGEQGLGSESDSKQSDFGSLWRQGLTPATGRNALDEITMIRI